MAENRQVYLKRQSVGVPTPDDFAVRSTEVPSCPDGGLLVQNLTLSLDPYLRGRIAGRHISGPLHAGDLMPGETVARVIESKAEGIQPGSLVCSGLGGWQDYAAISADNCRPADTDGLSPSLALGVLGMPGLTAYAGMIRLGEMKPGDTVLVSAATGPVGSTVGQIARIAGCRVIGIAGGPEKCRWATDVAGYDACIDYKAADLRTALSKAAPDGVDIYFDNVGGEILQVAMEQLALGARVILCGLMAQYNEQETPPGPNPGLVIKARAFVKGLVVYDHWDLAPTASKRIASWIRDGRFHVREDIASGLDRAADQFCRLMRGENFGKALVSIAD